VVQCGVWRLDAFHCDVVAQRPQHGIDVALGAGAQQLHREGIPAHLRDRGLNVEHDVRGQFGQSFVHPSSNLGDAAVYVEFGVEFGIATKSVTPRR
jgi:hypothetical protein